MGILDVFNNKPAAPIANEGKAPLFPADPLDRLPPAAADKLRSIRREASDANAVLRPLADELASLRDTLQRREAALRAYVSGGYDGQSHDPDGPVAARMRAEIEKLSADLLRLQTEFDERAARWRHLAAVRENVENYVTRLSDPVEAAPPVAATLGKGETHQQAVARVRKQLAKLHEDAQAIEDAPYHSSHAKKLAREKIEALAKRGQPNTLVSIEGGRPFEFATKIEGGGAVAVEGKMVALPFHRVTDTEATFCWAHRDEIIAAIEREIDENSDDASALSPETRAKKRQQIAAQILEVERLEEAIVCMASAQGLVIHRRPDCDPRAILQLADTAPAPRDS